MDAAKSGRPWARAQSGSAPGSVGKGVAAAVGGVGNDLVEGFPASYQPEIGAGTLLGRLEPLLEIDDFSIERRIALAQALVHGALLRNRVTQFHCLAVAAFRQPKLTLQQHGNRAEHDQQPAQVRQMKSPISVIAP